MLICFFSLTSSMYTNVRENAKETGFYLFSFFFLSLFFPLTSLPSIGILRAVGVPREWIARVAIYEAFVIVFSSCFMGLLIGFFLLFFFFSSSFLLLFPLLPFSHIPPSLYRNLRRLHNGPPKSAFHRHSHPLRAPHLPPFGNFCDFCYLCFYFDV